MEKDAVSQNVIDLRSIVPFEGDLTGAPACTVGGLGNCTRCREARKASSDANCSGFRFPR